MPCMHVNMLGRMPCATHALQLDNVALVASMLLMLLLLLHAVPSSPVYRSAKHIKQCSAGSHWFTVLLPRQNPASTSSADAAAAAAGGEIVSRLKDAGV